MLVERLLTNGHADPWSLSPRQAVAYAALAERRRQQERLDEYLLARAAQHADEKGDKSIREQLSDGSS